jgi:hypothetical protein
MVSKTKTKTKNKGKQTKGSKKSKSTLKKKSGIKRTSQRKRSSAVARTRRVPGKAKKTTTTPIGSTSGTSTQETKLLDDANMPSSLDEEDTTPQIQEESVPEVIHAVDEDMPSSSTDIADEDVENDNNTMTETR